MELRQLKYFIEVAEREHVSEAAEHLHVAQSAVSRQIANLEDELGVQLFEREGRNVKLTPIGKIFLTHSQSILKSVDRAVEQVNAYLDPERGSIKIGFPTSLASHLLPTVISAFKEKHPNVRFQLRQGSYYFLTEGVKNRDIDLAFLGPVPTDDFLLTGNILFTERIFALLPSNHILSERKSLRLRDLRNDEFVLFPEGYILQKIAIDACKQEGFLPNINAEGEDLDAIKGLVSAGMGVTLLPESTFYDTVPKFTVKVPIEDPIISRTVGIIVPSNRELPPSVQTFRRFIIDFFTILEKYQ
ncbi:LysR family transcriptional regulator [Niallia circulans]|jgi:LysR family transcriptional regulator, transcription activator of glutamate synthase operon|uniref:LysR family transcriptional regulator n=1 Tax=Niallia circulans TaxID=1397 RepID=A0A0J1IGM5_NIACI|nr:LysR family transcriptional regulator [Niallia circulans]KLV25097.1 LysR family transcriptional regulator [Niallia circulans]MCM2980279.1 LysR family transcriptional regulator [Niallia circulans]MDR4315096.1 LysR family transcriptional regulator [Niallia circulans]MED3839827.1 LysR family transcriptional regulator [Niallia circulans]MED4241313.1 LysR family transcriptional regulator [Niallia circulans]